MPSRAAIEAQKAMVNSPNHTVVYIPSGPMGVPVTGDWPHRIAGVEVFRPFKKAVVLHGCALRQSPPEGGHFLALTNQLDFGTPQLFAALEILA